MSFKKEIEVKFRLADKRETQKRLMALGGEIVSLQFQRDTRAKQPPEATALQHVFPRVRIESHKETLTIKVKSATDPVKPDGHGALREFFERDEYEIGIDDSETMLRALAALGFTDQRTLEKYRQTWRVEGYEAEVVVDCLPFGDYIEIEGQKEVIESLVAALGLETVPRVTDAYFIEVGRVIFVILFGLAFSDRLIGILLKITKISARKRLASREEYLQSGDVFAVQSLFARTLGNHFELAELFLQFIPLRSLRLLRCARIALKEVVKVLRVTRVVSVYFFIRHLRIGIFLSVSVVQGSVQLKRKLRL